MLKKIKKSIRNWILDTDSGVNRVNINKLDDFHDIESQTITMFKAHGGTCIKYSYYSNSKSGSSFTSKLYVVPDTEDLGDSIKNIIISEKLRGQHVHTS